MKWRVLLPILLAICALLLQAPHAFGEDGAAAPETGEPKPIALIPGDSMNLEIVEQIDPHYVVVKVGPNPVHNWFAGTFTNLPTDKEVTIGLSMAGCNTPGNSADVRKWVGLRPVMTYADPYKYETYEWFQKDEQGRWVSGDPFKKGEAKFAGTGKVPEQNVIPKEVAEQFLSGDGKYWQAWREIDIAETVTGINVFRMKQHFVRQSATLAMRVPYSYTYQQLLVQRIKNLNIPGVIVDEIGITQEGRKIQVIRVEDPKKTTPLRIFGRKLCFHSEKIPIVWVDYTADTNNTNPPMLLLMTAREHATEHASSWSIIGILSELIRNTPEAQQKRIGTSWLLIPIEDPDGCYNSTFDKLTSKFRDFKENTPTEVIAYINYLRAFLLSGRTPITAIGWHNVECSEAPNISSPMVILPDTSDDVKLNKYWFNQAVKQRYICGSVESQHQAIIPARLFGFCGKWYGSTSALIEVNDRFPANRLTLCKLQNIGTVFASTVPEYYKSKDDGKLIVSRVEKIKQDRLNIIKEYYQRFNRKIEEPTLNEIIDCCL